MGDTRHDDDVFYLDKVLRNCRGVYAFTVERGGSIGRRLYLDSHNNLPRELLIEEPLPYPQLYSATAMRRHYPQPRPRRGIVRRKTKSTQRQQEQKEDFAALRRPKRNREIYEFIRPTVWSLYLSRADPRTPSRISMQATSPATTPPRLD